MVWLALLFIVLPALEIALLIQVGGVIGPLNTLAIVIITGVIGAGLAKQQGLNTLARMQAATARGELPTGALVDGAIILVSGALLMTPGMITDVLGFCGLLPGGRELIKAGVMWAARRAAIRGTVSVQVPGQPFKSQPFGNEPFGGQPFGGPAPGQPYREPGRSGTVVDVEAQPLDD